MQRTPRFKRPATSAIGLTAPGLQIDGEVKSADTSVSNALYAPKLSPELRRYSGVIVVDASIRKVVFEAKDATEAQAIAAARNIGLHGEAFDEPKSAGMPAIEPVAYNTAATCRLLGDISRTTLYRLLVRGKLSRLPNMRRVMVTAASIKRYCAMAA